MSVASRFSIQLFFAGVSIVLASSLCAEEFREKKDSQLEKFLSMTLVQQKEELAKVFKHRVKLAENVSFHVDNVLEVRKIVGGNPGEILGTVKKNFTHWQMGGSFKVEAEVYPHVKIDPIQYITMSWDANEGVFMNFLEVDPSTHLVYGRLDVSHDPAINSNKYFLSWLNNGILDTSQGGVRYIFPYLLACQDMWKITAPFELDKILVSVPFSRDYDIESEGYYNVVLDPEKNYFPISGSLRHDGKFTQLDKVVTTFRSERFEVLESEQVGGVWMPVELYTFFTTSTNPEICNVNIAKIRQIQFGKVSPSDLKIKFPEGTSVVDVISGISYKVDASGKPIQSTIQPLDGLDPSQVKMPGSEPSRRINYIFMILGVGMIIVALYLQFKKRFASA